MINPDELIRGIAEQAIKTREQEITDTIESLLGSDVPRMREITDKFKEEEGRGRIIYYSEMKQLLDKHGIELIFFPADQRVGKWRLVDYKVFQHGELVAEIK